MTSRVSCMVNFRCEGHPASEPSRPYNLSVLFLDESAKQSLYVTLLVQMPLACSCLPVCCALADDITTKIEYVDSTLASKHPNDLQ